MRIRESSRRRVADGSRLSGRHLGGWNRLRRPRASTAGFSLLELIVATALMGLAVVGLLSLISVALSNAARVREYDRAAMLARTQMNRLLVQDPLPLEQPLEGAFDSASGWEARAEPFEFVGPPRAGGHFLARIALRVWWEADGRRKSVDVEGYRTMRVPSDQDGALIR